MENLASTKSDKYEAACFVGLGSSDMGSYKAHRWMGRVLRRSIANRCLRRLGLLIGWRPKANAEVDTRVDWRGLPACLLVLLHPANPKPVGHLECRKCCTIKTYFLCGEGSVTQVSILRYVERFSAQRLPS